MREGTREGVREREWTRDGGSEMAWVKQCKVGERGGTGRDVQGSVNRRESVSERE